MSEIFEHAYEGLCNLIHRFIDFVGMVGKCVLICLVYITIPLWAIPYAIYKKVKGGAK